MYAGNLPGRVGDYEHTRCPHCQTRLIERLGYVILNYQITAQRTCPSCGTSIPGIWPQNPKQVKTGGLGMPKLVHF